MSMEYVTGGTMLAQSASYVVRDADRILRERLMLGEFCYILTPRQMGKSSLMIQTAFALRERGIASAVLDLSKQGYNLDNSQWVNGLLEMLGDRLGLEAEIETFCRETVHSSPLQRWHWALRSVVLENILGPVVIFLDEIDITRRLRFETDEFFAAIRACYNARADDPAYRRLTFCLLGVATPAALIRDPLLTPFNIGTRIDLRDFTPAEATALQQGLGSDTATNRRLMERIYYWTHGHPYLTQRLCKAVAQDGALRSPARVDHYCQEIFLDSKVGLTEDNLTFVRRRLALEDSAQRANLLTLYQQILSGKRIVDNDADATVAELKLSGAVRAEEGALVPRNRIYRAVFDSRWIAEHMPGAELRRQRAAYRRGAFRAAMVSALLFLATVGCIGTVLYFHAREAQQQQESQRRIAETKRRYSYPADIARTIQALDNNSYLSAFKSLEKQRPADGETDRRGFEWRYLWQKSQGDRSLISCSEMNVFAIAVSPDGRFMAAGGQSKEGTTSAVRIWDIATHQRIAAFAYPGEVRSLAFSPDGNTLAGGGGVPYNSAKPGSVYLWDRTSRQQATSLSTAHQVNALAFSQDGKSLYIAGAQGYLSWWQIASQKETVVLPKMVEPNICLAISKGEKILGVGAVGGLLLYDQPAGGSVRALLHDPAVEISALAFSPDNTRLAVGNDRGMILLWDVATWSVRKTFQQPGKISSLAFSPDGKKLATACWDDTISLWDTDSEHRRILYGHIGQVNSVAFTPDGKTLVSGANDGTVRLWDMDPKHVLVERIPTGSFVCGIALSDDARTLATTDGEDTVRLWDASSGTPLGTLAGSHLQDTRFQFSPDGRMLASGYWTEWNLHLQAHRTSLVHAESSALLTYNTHGGANAYAVTMKDMILRRRTGGLTKDIQGVGGIALSPDGDTVAVAGTDRERTKYEDGTLELWSLRTRQWLGSIRGAHSNDITALAFSRDGKSLASGGWDHKVRVWEVSKILGMQDGREGHRTLTPIELEDQGAQVFAIAFTRDKKTVAVGTEDSKIRLCSLETGEVIAWLPDHQGTVTSLAFSYDDNLLVSGSVDGTVHFWRAASFARTDDPVRRNWYKLWSDKR
jgi:WD40 repeat protein